MLTGEIDCQDSDIDLRIEANMSVCISFRLTRTSGLYRARVALEESMCRMDVTLGRILGSSWHFTCAVCGHDGQNIQWRRRILSDKKDRLHSP